MIKTKGIFGYTVILGYYGTSKMCFLYPVRGIVVTKFGWGKMAKITTPFFSSKAFYHLFILSPNGN